MKFDVNSLNGLENFNEKQFGKNVELLKKAIADQRYPFVLDLTMNSNRGTSIGGFTVLKNGELTLEDTAVSFPSKGYIEPKGEQLWVHRSEFLFPVTCLSLAIPKCQGNGFYYLDHTTGQEGYLLLGKLARLYFKMSPLVFISSLEEENSNLGDFKNTLNKSTELNPLYIFLLEALGQSLPEFNTQPEIIREEIQTLTVLDSAYDGRIDYPVINGRLKTGIANLQGRREKYIVEQIRTSLERLMTLKGHEHDTTISTGPKEDQIKVGNLMTYFCRKYNLPDIEEKLQVVKQSKDTTMISPVDPLTERVVETGGSFLKGLSNLPVTSQTKEELPGYSTPALIPIEEPETPALEIIQVLEEQSKTPSSGLESLLPLEKNK